jgi:hypothetical protein
MFRSGSSAAILVLAKECNAFPNLSWHYPSPNLNLSSDFVVRYSSLLSAPFPHRFSFYIYTTKRARIKNQTLHIERKNCQNINSRAKINSKSLNIYQKNNPKTETR